VDQIISKLRRTDTELGKGKKVPEVCKLIGIAKQTYYRWRQKYGGMQPYFCRQRKITFLITVISLFESRVGNLVSKRLSAGTAVYRSEIRRVKLCSLQRDTFGTAK